MEGCLRFFVLRPNPIYGCWRFEGCPVFFSRFWFLAQLGYREIRGLNLSRLRVGPSQNGLSVSVSQRALQGLEAALLCFTAARPIRTTNDLARPQ